MRYVRFADVTPIIIKHCETVQDFLQNKPAEPASSSGGADGADGASTAVLGGSSLGAGASKASFGAGGSTGVGATQVVAKEAAEKPKRGADDGDSDSSDGACVRARVLDEESVPACASHCHCHCHCLQAPCEVRLGQGWLRRSFGSLFLLRDLSQQMITTPSRRLKSHHPLRRPSRP